MIVCLIWTMASVQYVVLDIVYVPVTVLRTTANVEHGKDLIALGPTLGRGIRTSAGPYDAKASSFSSLEDAQRRSPYSASP